MSNAYIAALDGTPIVYLDIDPSPAPLPVYSFAHEKKQTVPSKSEGGDIYPGEFHHYIGGGHSSGRKITINIPMMTREIYNSIMGLFTQCKPFIFSPDNGDTNYQCVPGNDVGEPELIDGSLYLKWRMTLHIVE